ncbi:(S)-N-methylcoclaurine 3'-hydroxylase isozyme 1-like [Malania oleifera]|uniref:(S)-N-methylcoclaurine 3'-hydroxylase isozyme 1-like n=1 Tax=Malania oleifera TaxID=397392 RepID=UPI0025AE377A|nr:(S)-N-methylcoclaurine 3'-hydroxylase isozyme 1-like [Malania oleifera]
MGLINILLEEISFFPTLLLLSIPILFVILKSFLLKGNSYSLPPGPRPWPVIGNIHQMGNMPHVTLSNLAKVHGPLMSLRLGGQLLIVGSSTTAAMEILKTHDRVLSGRYIMHALPVKSPELNHLSLAFASECTKPWKLLRTICRTELISHKALDSQIKLREKKVMEMVEFLGKNGGKAVNVGEIVFATAFNILGHVMFSRDLVDFQGRGMGGEMKELITRILELISSPNISDFYPIVGRWDVQGIRKKTHETFRSVFTIWDCIITERREQTKDSRPGDFLDFLLHTGFNNDQINQFFMELFIGGSETTSETTAWAMAELIKNQESMQKLCKELANEIGGDIVRDSHLPNLPYLQACLKETMRLHPVVPLILPHQALETCEVMGYNVPKDSQVLVNVWAIGRDPKHWKDPLSFKPERFLNSSLDYKGNDFELLPFSAGRRICPGLPLAARKIPLFVATLVHSFDWHLPGNMDAAKLDMSEKVSTVLRREQPLHLIPTVRK